MDGYSTNDENYLAIVKNLIKEKNEILITVRNPYQAGNKDLFLINSFEAFKSIIAKREPQDLIIIDNSFKKVAQGIASRDFIKLLIDKIEIQENEDLVVIFPEFNGNSEYWKDYFENKEELEDYLKANMDQYVVVYIEPHELEEDKMIYAYVPDSDGIIRPGRY